MELVLLKKSQDGQELFDMASWTDPTGRYTGKGGKGFVLFGRMSNPKAILLIVIAGAIVYYFAIHRRR